jgi:hypothetical protein
MSFFQVFPLFLQASQHATDPFWTHLFEQMAHAKYPSGIYFDPTSQIIFCKLKGKEGMLSLESIASDPTLVYQETRSFLQEKVGLHSQQEHFVQLQQFRDRLVQPHESWIQVRKKNIRDLLLEQYVVSLRTLYQLSFRQLRHLYSLLLMGVQFKKVLPHHIRFEWGKIQSIEGVTLDTHTFHVEPCLLVHSTADCDEDPSSLFDEQG